MWYYSLLFMFSCSIEIMCQEIGMLGPAEIILKSVEECTDKELYPYHLYANKKKHNRTTDVINAEVDLTNFDAGSLIGFHGALAKFGDGGYKPNYYNMEEPDLCKFLMKHGEDAFRNFLDNIGHPTTECPFILGSYNLKDYVVDYNKLPDKLLYGDFRIDFSMTQNDEKMNCISMFVTSKAKMSLGR